MPPSVKIVAGFPAWYWGANTASIHFADHNSGTPRALADVISLIRGQVASIRASADGARFGGIMAWSTYDDGNSNSPAYGFAAGLADCAIHNQCD